MASETNEYTGKSFVFPSRDQLRFRLHGRTFGVPGYLKGARQLPAPPASLDVSKGRSIKYPILGNDQVGDCYLCDALHQIQSWTGNASTQVQFDANEAINRYFSLSGGDNGLSDSQIFPAWQNGLLPVNGPHRILDEITVDPADETKIRTGMWLFCGASWTTTMFRDWVQNAAPGYVWDSSNAGGIVVGGHAMHLTGYGSNYYNVETWAIDPPVQVTPNGMRYADPEITLQFSLDMFNAQGIAPHCGMDYATLADLWTLAGGKPLPPSPFGPPTPPHVCPPGQHWDGSACVPDGPVPPVPQTFTVNIPQQAVVRSSWFDPGHVPAFSVTGTLGQSSALTIPPLLGRLLRFVCSGAVPLPPQWALIVQILCGLVPPEGARSEAVAIPPWVVPILREACKLAPSLPAPYNLLAQFVCAMIPAQAPCGGCK